MTEGEIQALAIADKYVGHYTSIDQVKKLAEEVVELSMALTEGDTHHIREEIGDCAFILAHILSKLPRRIPGATVPDSILTEIVIASQKMEMRAQQGSVFDKSKR